MWDWGGAKTFDVDASPTQNMRTLDMYNIPHSRMKKAFDNFTFLCLSVKVSPRLLGGVMDNKWHTRVIFESFLPKFMIFPPIHESHLT